MPNSRAVVDGSLARVCLVQEHFMLAFDLKVFQNWVIFARFLHIVQIGGFWDASEHPSPNGSLLGLDFIVANLQLGFREGFGLGKFVLVDVVCNVKTEPRFFPCSM
jgi:hypothetical protein